MKGESGVSAWMFSPAQENKSYKTYTTYKTYDTAQDIRPVKSEKENPPSAPLTEVVEAVAQHQAAGFSLSTAKNITDSFAKVNPIPKKTENPLSGQSEIPSKESARLYSLQKIPKSIEEDRQMPGHPLPEKVKYGSIKELYDIYKREYLGQTIQTISGHRMTFKPGHFFRLIAQTPEDGMRKGFITKAANAKRCDSDD